MLTVLALLAGSSSVASAHVPLPPPQVSFFTVEPTPLSTWSELCYRPGAFRGQTVRLRIQFNSMIETWNPYMTRFGNDQFVALQAWSDEQRLWVKQDYDSGAVRLFARRGSRTSETLQDAAMYERYEIEGVVREVFLDQPWIEIESIRPLSDHVTEGTIIHAAKALELEEQGAWDLALLELDQALAALLPEHVRAELSAERESVRVQARPVEIPIEKRKTTPPHAPRD